MSTFTARPCARQNSVLCLVPWAVLRPFLLPAASAASRCRHAPALRSLSGCLCFPRRGGGKQRVDWQPHLIQPRLIPLPPIPLPEFGQDSDSGPPPVSEIRPWGCEITQKQFGLRNSLGRVLLACSHPKASQRRERCRKACPLPGPVPQTCLHS